MDDNELQNRGMMTTTHALMRQTNDGEEGERGIYGAASWIIVDGEGHSSTFGASQGGCVIVNGGGDCSWQKSTSAKNFLVFEVIVFVAKDLTFDYKPTDSYFQLNSDGGFPCNGKHIP